MAEREGIRTLDRLAPIPRLWRGALNRSATSPFAGKLLDAGIFIKPGARTNYSYGKARATEINRKLICPFTRERVEEFMQS